MHLRAFMGKNPIQYTKILSPTISQLRKEEKNNMIGSEGRPVQLRAFMRENQIQFEKMSRYIKTQSEEKMNKSN